MLLAGSGVEANQGATDGIGAVARFRSAKGIAYDSVSKRLLIADTGNRVIRTVGLDGNTALLAGAVGVVGSTDGVGGAARFRSPTGLSADTAGNVFVADPSNTDNPFPFGSVRKVTPAASTSTRTTVVSTDGRDFMLPLLTATYANGDIAVSDGVTVRYLKGDSALVIKLAGGGAAGSVDGVGAAASFTDIRAMIVSGDNIYVLDRVGATGGSTYSLIRKITPGGVVSTFAGRREQTSVLTPGTAVQNKLPFRASGLALDADGNLITFGPVSAQGDGFINITVQGVASVAYTVTVSDVIDKLFTTVVQMTSIGGRKFAATSGAFGTAVFTINLP